MDKELLFKPRVTEAEVEIPGVGTVRVRGLTRGQVFAMQQKEGTAAQERVMLAFGMVDPQVTEAEAGRWQEASPAGELEPVTLRIQELSGLAEGADKAAVQSFRDASDAGVRALPGAEAGDDGVPPPPRDEQ